MTIVVHSCPNLDNVNEDILKEAPTRCEVNTVVGANGLSKSAYLAAASVRETALDFNCSSIVSKELVESRSP
jgi:hypothetical protein